MCGINGILSDNGTITGKISRMNALLRHRGPDDEGYVCINTDGSLVTEFSGADTIPFYKEKLPNIESADFHGRKHNLVLGHRRLSVIDLSAKGHGPMCDSTGTVWITYNGEIYNYIELREELRKTGSTFQTESDTEVILEAYIKWGVDCLNRFNGMWAFAIWDSREKYLFIARDRFGIKPLYYTKQNEYFAFSSELRPLIALDNSLNEINTSRIPFYLLYGNRLNSEETYYKNIFSLKPSHYIVLKDGNPKQHRYYDVPAMELESFSERELSAKLVELLSDSVKLRFRSDVPVGTCLSGGFDSSSIISLSAAIKQTGLNTFSAVWKDKSSDESRYIDIVNARFGCTENKIEPKAEDFEKVFSELSYYQEIPTEGPGLYPQWHVMQKAKNKVTVLLDGQGGDEVFGGYFMMGAYLRSLIEDRNVLGLFKNLKHFYSFLHKSGIHSFSSWIFPKMYNSVVRGFFARRSKILNRDLAAIMDSKQFHFDSQPPKKFKSHINNLSYHLMLNITIPTLLHYEDRSSMAHSIESRVPFLDYRLVEFGLNLPKKHLANKDTSRPLYRKALAAYLPAEIVARKDKLGFPTPFTVWTRTVLKDYILSKLETANDHFFDFVNKQYLDTILKEHFEKKRDCGWEIWRFLSLQSFLNMHK